MELKSNHIIPIAMNSNQKTINSLSLLGIAGGLLLVSISMTFFGGVFITLFTLSLTANLLLPNNQ